MTEAEILQRLKPGSWVSKPERKALEAMLTKIRSGSAAAAAVSSERVVVRPDVFAKGSPAIVGCSSFVYWTSKAFDVARGTSLARYANAIARIEENHDANGIVAGWCDMAGKSVSVCPRTWKVASTKRYAVFLIHEGAHIVHGPDEPTAIRVENQARSELGFWFMEDENSQHNAAWQRELQRRAG